MFCQRSLHRGAEAAGCRGEPLVKVGHMSTTGLSSTPACRCPQVALGSPGVPMGNELAGGDGDQRRVALRQAAVGAVGTQHPLGGGLGVARRGRLLGGRCCSGTWAGLRALQAAVVRQCGGVAAAGARS
ncbi:hypothetical protein HK405_011984 [Cladochytrium tenue]|nr:hypothetical protein HK405_011984 [Cladochytrium tenue]